MLDENAELTADSQTTETTEAPKEQGMAALNIEELEQHLTDAIENEDYELASRLRDEINKRSES